MRCSKLKTFRRLQIMEASELAGSPVCGFGLAAASKVSNASNFFVMKMTDVPRYWKCPAAPATFWGRATGTALPSNSRH